MSIKSNPESDKLTLVLDNGDFKAFKELQEKWNFKDEQSALKFMMSIVLLANDHTVTINTDEGMQKVKPANEFLKQE